MCINYYKTIVPLQQNTLKESNQEPIAHSVHTLPLDQTGTIIAPMKVNVCRQL